MSQPPLDLDQRKVELARFLNYDWTLPTDMDAFERDSELWQEALKSLIEDRHAGERPLVTERVLQAIEVFSDETAHWTRKLLHALDPETLGYTLSVTDQRGRAGRDVTIASFVSSFGISRRRSLKSGVQARLVLAEIALAERADAQLKVIVGSPVFNENLVALLIAHAPRGGVEARMDAMVAAGIGREAQIAGVFWCLSAHRYPQGSEERPTDAEVMNALFRGDLDERRRLITLAQDFLKEPRPKSMGLFPASMLKAHVDLIERRLAVAESVRHAPTWAAP